jgi:hypothetical protein
MNGETVSYRAAFVLYPSRAASRAVRGPTLKDSQIEARVTGSVACKLLHMLNSVAHVILFLEDRRCYSLNLRRNAAYPASGLGSRPTIPRRRS